MNISLHQFIVLFFALQMLKLDLDKLQVQSNKGVSSEVQSAQGE